MNVTYIVGRPHARGQQQQSPSLVFAAATAASFLAFVFMAVIVGLLHWAVIVVYVLASVVTYLAYADDKRAA